MVAKIEFAAAYIEACLAELDAPKPGNVHRFAPGHDMSVADFVRSAEASAGPIAARGARVGVRIRAAVEATLSAVGQNTNLGIILLCAPLAAATESAQVALRPALAGVLDNLDRADAADVFSAIAAANPGGLGRATRHDVNAPATATLREAMAEACGPGSHRAPICHGLRRHFLARLAGAGDGPQAAKRPSLVDARRLFDVSRRDARHAYLAQI